MFKACGSIGRSAILMLLRERADMGARAIRDRCTSDPISMHEQSAMGWETRAITDRVTKQIVTIFSKTCNKNCFSHSLYLSRAREIFHVSRVS